MKTLLISFVVSVYGILVSFFLCGCSNEGNSSPILGSPIPFYIFCGITILLEIGILFYSIFNRKNMEKDVFKTSLIIKSVLIPEHIVTFVLSIIIGVIGIFSIVTLFWLASLPLVLAGFVILVCDYLVTVNSGLPTLFYLIAHNKEDNPIRVVICSIALFVPILNFADSIYLFVYFNNKENNKQALES